uniref:Uncharacterized protein n=1 Tax=Arundo donax TaxID=35708 RepID=A0A0A9C6V7_ARUDO
MALPSVLLNGSILPVSSLLYCFMELTGAPLW